MIDHAIDVASLAVGLNTLSVPTTGPVAWPQERPTWLRGTLSEARSVKLPGEEYGDGRGPDGGYLTGETEDYLLRPEAGPDAAIDVDARSGVDVDGPRVVMRFAYQNVGTAPTRSAVINFPVPAALRDGGFTLRAAPGWSRRSTPQRMTCGSLIWALCAPMALVTSF